MFKALLSLPVAAIALICTAPAQAQDLPGASSGRLPSLCRTSAAMEAGPCNPGQVPAFSILGGRLAHAIMFFGGSRARLVEPAPNADAVSARSGQAPAVQPARLLQPPERPAFARPLLTY